MVSNVIGSKQVGYFGAKNVVLSCSQLHTLQADMAAMLGFLARRAIMTRNPRSSGISFFHSVYAINRQEACLHTRSSKQKTISMSKTSAISAVLFSRLLTRMGRASAGKLANIQLRCLESNGGLVRHARLGLTLNKASDQIGTTFCHVAHVQAINHFPGLLQR